MLPGDTSDLRKQRGAFFTPDAIAEFLTAWALQGRRSPGLVLDPTCGEGAFLVAAARYQAARSEDDPRSLGIFGLDVHQESLDETRNLLERSAQSGATLLQGDFFEEPFPGQLGARLPLMDAVVGNPPFVRYHEHRGDTRKFAAAAALAQGVRLSGLASSWAALLVHSAAFLKPDGRIAMVLPAELLSVGYAEPVRRWLKRRFQAVHLVLFDRLQFEDAEEQVVLLVARGSGGCDAFSLHHVTDASELSTLHIFDAEAFAPMDEGKWTDLLLPQEARGLLRRVAIDHFESLATHATSELGTVTGANRFFTLSEATRAEYNLAEGRHVVRTVPPGTRHLRGLHFTAGLWEQLKLDGERVWMLAPSVTRTPSGGFARYLALGESLGVPDGYKCSIRSPWWRPPAQPAPDLFFTYMSHVSPRLIRNEAATTFVNSMHGVRFRPEAPEILVDALPLLVLNTVTRLSAEIIGRSYGGGILKMEPREAADLPVPKLDALKSAWEVLKPRRHQLDELVRVGEVDQVTREVDAALLDDVMAPAELQILGAALARRRRMRQGRSSNGVQE